jgi:hypothetical protein
MTFFKTARPTFHAHTREMNRHCSAYSDPLGAGNWATGTTFFEQHNEYFRYLFFF